MFDPRVPHGRDKRVDNVGLMTAGKRDLLKRQFLAREVWLVGLQETRLPNTEVLPDADFLMLSAQATPQGHGGCALWINKRHIFATDSQRKHRLDPKGVTVVSSSPRHLQAHIELPRLRLVVLVVHGPRAASPRDPAVSQFWAARAREVQARPSGMDCIVLADAKRSHWLPRKPPMLEGTGRRKRTMKANASMTFCIGRIVWCPPLSPVATLASIGRGGPRERTEFCIDWITLQSPLIGFHSSLRRTFGGTSKHSRLDRITLRQCSQSALADFRSRPDTPLSPASLSDHRWTVQIRNGMPFDKLSRPCQPFLGLLTLTRTIISGLPHLRGLQPPCVKALPAFLGRNICSRIPCI